MSKTRKASPVTKSEALELLASAVHYCQQSGLKVKYANRDASLVLSVDGATAQVGDAGTRFVLVASIAGKTTETICQQRA